MAAAADNFDDRHTADTVGKEFAGGYYDAASGSNNNKGLLMERFCDHKSKYLFLRYGRGPEFQVRGTAEIAKFAVRMKYHECAVAVVSVDAIKVRRPNLFAVLAVCKLTRLENGVAHEFVQSTVVRYVPSSTENRFVIVGTVFKFADETAADDGLEPEIEPPSSAPEQLLPSNNNIDNYRSTSAGPPEPSASVDGGVVIDAEPDGKPQTAKTKKRAKHKAAMLLRTAVNETSAAAAVDGRTVGISSTVSVVSADDDDDGPETERRPATGKTGQGTTNGAVTTDGSRETETKPPAKNLVKIPTTAAATAGSYNNADDLTNNSGGLLYVSGLPRAVRHDDIHKAFSRFDEIVQLNICTKKKKGRRRPNRFTVEFSDPGTAVKVAKLGTVLLDNGVKVVVQQLEGKQIGRPRIVKQQQ